MDLIWYCWPRDLLIAWLALSCTARNGSLPRAQALKITTDPADVANRTFTHVIVGGGTAGLTVASRLAENPELSIVVIEAGPDAQNDTLVNDPAEDETVSDSIYSWAYTMTPQGSKGVNLSMPQGKVLGGCSAINGMEWTRATFDQYDALERLGNPGWNSTELFKYMLKSEHFHPPNPTQLSLGATYDPSPLIHNTTGNFVSSSYPNPYSAAQSFGVYIDVMLAYFEPVGLIQAEDLCSGNPNGAGRLAYSIIPGVVQVDARNNSDNTSVVEPNVRSSSARAYIYPFLQDKDAKDNLVVLVEHQAIGIVWGDQSEEEGCDEDGPLARATGVRFTKTLVENGTVEGETVYEVDAGKEVVVAAGAIGSPHFLELSGVGNGTILSSVGIPVKVNLPSIGTNLQDQSLISEDYEANSSVPATFYNTTNAPNVGVSSYLTLGQVLGFENGNISAAELLDSVQERAEDIVAMGGFTSVSGLVRILREQAQSMAYRQAPVIEMSWGSLGSIIGLVIWNLLPQVRGTVHVRSSDPAVLPTLNPLYLSPLGPPIDLYLVSNATKHGRSIFQTPPLSTLVTTELEPSFETVPQNATDEVWQEYALATVGPTIHPIGTVAMLPREDGGAVDSELKVYGTENVRVVDSSVIPMQLSAHLSATVYGIAEKAADIIKAAAG